MNADEALAILDQLLQKQQKSLSRIQELVFVHAWQAKTYQEIADLVGYDGDYIREVGAELWQELSVALGDRVSKKNLHAVLRRQSLLINPTVKLADSNSASNLELSPESIVSKRQLGHQDWGGADDVSIFFGRLSELETLEQWIILERCRAIAILGMGGIGKTALAITLAEEIQGGFEFIIWRSLRAMPTMIETLTSLLNSLAPKNSEIPTTVEKCLSVLIDYLQKYRCLLILDQVEAVLAPLEDQAAADYGELFRRIAMAQHQSCLIVVSQAPPQEFNLLEGARVRSLFLSGLSVSESRELFEEKGEFVGSESQWQALIDAYGGNPMMLNVIATVAHKFFDCQISPILTMFEQEQWLPEAIARLLNPQFQRLSAEEQQVMIWLSTQVEVPTLATLPTDSLPTASVQELFVILEKLQQRSLLEKGKTGWRLPLVFKAYLK